MSNDTYLAVYVGSPDSPNMKAWTALSDAERGAKQQEGMAAWGAWMQKHSAAVVVMGGPLGKTKRVSRKGIEDTRNMMSGYVVVRASSHEEAAKLFEGHPHFSIFPGDGVEIMPVLPIPGA